MKTTEIGKQAESRVATYLERAGFKILARNWRTRVCEIDIIALKEGVVYFVEVKFRSSATQGRGLEYITAKKLKKLHFAADVWVQQNNWNGDYRLLAAAASKDVEIEIVELN